MEAWQALVLGIIEGITEYLPVSSTGHLLIAQNLLGIGVANEQEKIAADTFAICIQGGAILAVLGLYFKRVLMMKDGLLGRNPDGLKLFILIVAGFLPAAVLGVIFDDWIEATLFKPWPIVAALLAGGIAILLIEKAKPRDPGASSGRDLLEMTWKMALVIGFMQCIAMWPGTSRSLMTILGGLLVGLSVKAAVEYSFLLGVVTLTAATAKKALWPVSGLDPAWDVWFGGTKLLWETYGAMPLLVGIFSAAISAALAVKWLVTYLQRHGLSIFGWYRIILAAVLAALFVTGMVTV
ncbi:MAG: undecaprenyl-diphosphate phosphatase [Verrucomicrobia bacterium]|nr:MAG: undecaprenyl-diphosphate phosphatase [Verrucomicrobiota bacterium]